MLLTALLDAAPALSAPLDYSTLGIYGAMIGVVSWFSKSALTTMDRRLGEIVERIGALAKDHSTTVDRVCQSFDAATKAANERNEKLADRLVEVTRECGVAKKSPGQG